MELDPRRLGVLATVARTGGVLAAAEALHVTPSAISQQVARLEREAGVALVVRGARRISLTAAGVILAERGERILAELAGARADLGTLTDRASGTVTVVTFPTAVTSLVAPTAIRLREAHPGITLRVEEQADEPLESLLAGSVDLLIIERDAAARERTPRGLRDVSLLDDPYLVAIPSTWQRPTSLDDLADLDWVASAPGSAADSVLLGTVQRGGRRPRIAHRALEFPAVLALVAAGLGAALLPQLALPDPGSRLAQDVRAVPLPGLGARRLLVRHRSARYEPSPAVAAVVAALTQTATNLG